MNIFAFVLEVIDDEVKAKVHENCRISFKNRIVRKEEQKRKYDMRKKEEENKIELKREEVEREGVDKSSQRVKQNEVDRSKRKCFICDKKLNSDENSFNKGGLGRCELTQSKEALLKAMRIKLSFQLRVISFTKQLNDLMFYLEVVILIFLLLMSIIIRSATLLLLTVMNLKNPQLMIAWILRTI